MTIAILMQQKKAAVIKENEIKIGVLYQNKNSKSFMERLPNRKNTKTSHYEEVRHYEISELLKGLE